MHRTYQLVAVSPTLFKPGNKASKTRGGVNLILEHHNSIENVIVIFPRIERGPVVRTALRAVAGGGTVRFTPVPKDIHFVLYATM